MKTATVIRRSFIAMFWGWVACSLTNVCLLIGWMLVTEPSGGGKADQIALQLILMGAAFAVVIFGAWLLIFLPVDLLVKESSVLRKPQWAALCGALAGALSILVPFGLDGSDRPLNFNPVLWIGLLLAAICGLTAALHVVLHHPRTRCEQASPQSRDGGVPASLSNNRPNNL